MFGGSKEYEKFKSMWEGKGYEKVFFERDLIVGYVFDLVLVLVKVIYNMVEDGYNVISIKGLKFGVDKGEGFLFSEIGVIFLDYIIKVNIFGVIDCKFFGINCFLFEVRFDIVNMCLYGFEIVV